MRLILPKENENTITRAEDFSGIALTGWSRYDHFAVLAELLPVAVPSLILNLALTNAYFTGKAENKAFDELIHVLKCQEPFPFHSIQEMRVDQSVWIFGHCDFPGRAVHKLVLNYQTLVARFEYVMKAYESNGWVSEYNIKHRYTSPHRVFQLFPEEGFAAQNLLKGVLLFKQDAAQDLGEVYDSSVVDEWIEEKVGPIEERLIKLGEIFQDLLEVKTWPRRPFR